MNTEIWKPVVGYEGLYEVSNMGNVISLIDNHSIKRKKKLSLYIDSHGYIKISLFLDKKQKSYKAHRLVAQAFIPNPENKPQVNHKNGVKTENKVENLEWCNSSENHIHSYRILKRNAAHSGKFGGKHPASKRILQLSKEGIIISEWTSIISASKGLGISKHGISACCLGVQKTSGGFIWKYL